MRTWRTKVAAESINPRLYPRSASVGELLVLNLPDYQITQLPNPFSLIPLPIPIPDWRGFCEPHPSSSQIGVGLSDLIVDWRRVALSFRFRAMSAMTRSRRFLRPSACVLQPDPHPGIDVLLQTKAQPQFDRAVTERSKPFFRYISGLESRSKLTAGSECLNFQRTAAAHPEAQPDISAIEEANQLRIRTCTSHGFSPA